MIEVPTGIETNRNGRCPVSGLPVLQRPEWRYTSSSTDYKISVSVVGECILLARVSGNGSLEDLKNSLALTRSIEKRAFPSGKKYVHIGDYTDLKGLSFAGRKQFISEMAKRTQLAGIVFFGLSALFRLSTNLGRRLNIVKFEVKIARDYREAVTLSLQLLSSVSGPYDKAVSRESKWPPLSQGDGVTVEISDGMEIISHPDWELVCDGFSTKLSVIDRKILHSVSTGFMREDSVELVTRLREKVNLSKGEPRGFDYIVADVGATEGASRKARGKYMKSLKQWHAAAPFRMFILYGVNRFMRAAAYLAVPFMPFKVRVAKNLEDVFAIIRRDEESAESPYPDVKATGIAPDDSTSPELKKYVDDLLQYLGSVNWEKDGFESPIEKTPFHPFNPVFEAIRVIKGELDELFEERKQALEEKKKLQKKLQNARKMEAIGMLAGGVAHDLNNILSAIVSYPELLIMDLPEGSPLEKPLETIKNSGEKAAAIVQDLLTLARRGVIVRQVVDLGKIVSDYLKSPEFEKLKFYHQGVEIRTHLGEEALNIEGSTIHLFKTVMNLVSNAAEAMPDGGMLELSVAARYLDTPLDGYVRIPRGDYVVLSVSDNGIGIGAEDLDRIFEPFYTKKVMGRSGTGLGMAVVWGSVRDHGGFIDISTKEGQGSSFTLYFPTFQGERPADRTIFTVDHYRSKGESILVVDDLREQRFIATEMLTKLGYRASAVESGETALDYLSKNRVDLVVLDMIMEQGLDGLEAYRRIVELLPGVRTILASGYSESERVKEAQDLGAGPYLKKPYSMEDLAIAVRQELDR